VSQQQSMETQTSGLTITGVRAMTARWPFTNS
jgi:hypothetical protein